MLRQAFSRVAGARSVSSLGSIAAFSSTAASRITPTATPRYARLATCATSMLCAPAAFPISATATLLPAPFAFAPVRAFSSADANKGDSADAGAAAAAGAASAAAAVARGVPAAATASASKDEERMKNSMNFGAKAQQARMTWTPLLFALVLGLGGYLYLQTTEKKQKSVSATVTHQSGKIEIGGPFTGLIDQDGRPASSDQYKGEYQLLYFGFTHCPDICPTELQKMMRAINKIEAKNPSLAALIRPIFISVDPLRDTVPQLKKYAENYHPRIRWLTGPNDALLDVAKKFRIYFSMPEDVTAEDDYNVDHSIFFFLMDRQGSLLNYYGQNMNAEEIATSMTRIIKDDIKAHPLDGSAAVADAAAAAPAAAVANK